MARTYGPSYERIWRDALLLPPYERLLDSLASELAAHSGLAQEEAAERLRLAWDGRRARLERDFPAGGDADRLAAYYASSDEGIARSLYWHSLVPDRYALHSVAGLHVVQQFAEGESVLDYGHGVGSTGILFARHGFDVTLADVSAPYRSFATQRLAARGLSARFVDLLAEEPPAEAFDAVVSFDVLEHIRDPLGAISRMYRALRPGGLLVLNVAFGLDPDNPEHLLRRRLGLVDRIRQLGFERIPSPTLLVHYRRDVGGAKRRLYRLQDVVSAAVDDLTARAPRLGRLVRPTRVPEI